MKNLKQRVVTSAMLTLAMAGMFSSLVASAKAELIIHTSKGNDGKTTMVVKDDSQKKLPPPQLGIAPATINETLELSTGKLDTSITLYNYSDKPKAIKLTLIDLDKNGKPIAPSESTLRPWSLINPTQFTVIGGGEGYQTVRLSIRPPMSFTKGQYRAMLLIEQQVDNAVSYDADGEGLTFQLGSRYGLPLTINVK